jgi:hypothetical protein
MKMPALWRVLLVSSVTAMCAYVLHRLMRAEYVENMFVAVVCFALPAWLVLRFGFFGILPGVISFWGLVFLAGEIQYARHPESRGIGSAIWILAGWFYGFAYCLLLWGVRGLVLFAMAKVRNLEGR